MLTLPASAILHSLAIVQLQFSLLLLGIYAKLVIQHNVSS